MDELTSILVCLYYREGMVVIGTLDVRSIRRYCLECITVHRWMGYCSRESRDWPELQLIDQPFQDLCENCCESGSMLQICLLYQRYKAGEACTWHIYSK